MGHIIWPTKINTLGFELYDLMFWRNVPPLAKGQALTHKLWVIMGFRLFKSRKIQKDIKKGSPGTAELLRLGVFKIQMENSNDKKLQNDDIQKNDDIKFIG